MYKIVLLPSAEKDLDRIDPQGFVQIQSKVEELRHDPRAMGSLKLTGQEGYRIRSGDYRIIYRIDDHVKTVYIYRVKHRKDAYR